MTQTHAKPYHTGVFIGRFQPFHLGHWHIIHRGLEQCEQLLLMVGCSNRARSAKNPFDVEERIKLIQDCLQELDPKNAKRVMCIATTDHPYDEQRWIDNIRRHTKQHAKGKSIALVGHDKDASTYYLKHFADWEQVNVENYHGVSATQIRHTFFRVSREDQIANMVEIPQATINFLKQFYQTDLYQHLRAEAEFIQAYRQEWANTPYPVVYVTTDAVVTCKDHILLIKRGRNPGKGLYALPGGFVEVDEWVAEGLVRELQEETEIDIPAEKLQQHLKNMHVFDRPGRSQIGRVITHAGHVDLPGPKPAINPADDAVEVMWMPLKQFWDMSHQMHDDHYFIVEWYLKKR